MRGGAITSHPPPTDREPRASAPVLDGQAGRKARRLHPQPLSYAESLLRYVKSQDLTGRQWEVSADAEQDMTQADLAIPPTLATPARRLSGWLCDCMPFAIAGFVAGIVAGATDSSGATTAVFLALAVVYLIWVVVAARQGQTPGKQLLDTYIIREDGFRSWIRLRDCSGSSHQGDSIRHPCLDNAVYRVDRQLLVVHMGCE